ncbi:MAG: PilZ domain-containing protein [Thermodesulfobacteriota bacterium]|nr:PilZ domain-containing protein [Thermodesulfobacteriota bacterium]
MNDEYNEKRQCVRVIVSVPAKVRLVDGEEAENLAEEETAPTPADPVHTELSGFENHLLPEQPQLDPRVTDFLVQIDEKLDRLLELLDDREKNQNTLDVRDTFDLSGTGIRLILSECLEIGQCIHITLKVPEIPFGKITAYGEVVRVSEFSQSPEMLYEAGVRFFNLSRREQETIIAYTFWKQRESIRSQKENKTSG